MDLSAHGLIRYLKIYPVSDYLKMTGGGHSTKEGEAQKGQSIFIHGQLSFYA
jgi:hypothetical protein